VKARWYGGTSYSFTGASLHSTFELCIASVQAGLKNQEKSGQALMLFLQQAKQNEKKRCMNSKQVEVEDGRCITTTTSVHTTMFFPYSRNDDWHVLLVVAVASHLAHSFLSLITGASFILNSSHLGMSCSQRPPISPCDDSLIYLLQLYLRSSDSILALINF
jgi:hypothetical protein